MSPQEQWNGKCHNCESKLICANCNHTPNISAFLAAQREKLVKEVKALKVLKSRSSDESYGDGAWNHAINEVLALLSGEEK